MLYVIRLLVLGLWLGAMAGFAFLFAPVAFVHVGSTPAFAATIASCLRLMTRAGDWLGIAAAAITLFDRLETRRRAAAIVGCIAVAIALGAYETSHVVSQMESTQLLTPAYEALHRTSSTMYSIVLLAVTVSFIIAATSRRGIRS